MTKPIPGGPRALLYRKRILNGAREQLCREARPFGVLEAAAWTKVPRGAMVYLALNGLVAEGALVKVNHHYYLREFWEALQKAAKRVI